MEEVYRRNRPYGGRKHREKHAARSSAYKQTMVRQSFFCLLLFSLCLFVKVYPEEQMDIARNCIRLMLDTHTDFTKVPKNIQNFYRTYILREEERALEQKEVLSALMPPVVAPVTSPFGQRTNPVDGEEKFHYGIDLGAAEGEKIKCAAQGTAQEVGTNDEYGNYILVSHGDEIYTLYAHCREVLPESGDDILAGQVIATCGSTGNATGPHLHFELRNGETYLDPMEFIDFKQDEKND